MPCFEDCGCTCYVLNDEFDNKISTETRLDVTLREILDSHGGWYDDGDEGRFPGDIEGLGLGTVTGVYILWRQTGYCGNHEAEHLKAFYVGKAGRGMTPRLKAHQAMKQIGAGLSTEISIWPAQNRQAKYVEQLLLDIYNLPLNKSENSGILNLCQHIKPAEWN